MNAQDLTTYLYKHIPISKAMGVQVREVTFEQVSLEIPLEPNLNHRQTAFGGSISAVATLAAWCVVNFRLSSPDQSPRLVIQSHQIDYLKPIEGKFEAVTEPIEPVEWNRFVVTLGKKGRARIKVRSQIMFNAAIAAQFTGQFVAFAQPRSQMS